MQGGDRASAVATQGGGALCEATAATQQQGRSGCPRARESSGGGSAVGGRAAAAACSTHRAPRFRDTERGVNSVPVVARALAAAAGVAWRQEQDIWRVVGCPDVCSSALTQLARANYTEAPLVLQAVLRLIAAKADVNARNPDGCTALYLAAKKAEQEHVLHKEGGPRLGIVRALVLAKADPSRALSCCEAWGGDGVNALHAALTASAQDGTLGHLQTEQVRSILSRQ